MEFRVRSARTDRIHRPRSSGRTPYVMTKSLFHPELFRLTMRAFPREEQSPECPRDLTDPTHRGFRHCGIRYQRNQLSWRKEHHGEQISSQGYGAGSEMIGRMGRFWLLWRGFGGFDGKERRCRWRGNMHT